MPGTHRAGGCLLYLSAQLYISFASTYRRLLAENDVGSSVEGQIQPCHTGRFVMFSVITKIYKKQIK
jgi:hypothetical protein